MTQTQTDQRSRIFSWADPAINAVHIGRRSGLALLRAMTDGELPTPPVLRMLGVDSVEVDEGRATVLLTPQEFHYNPLGSVHGGVLATILDTAAGCAVHSTLPAGVGYTSMDLATKFLRPVTIESGQLRCEGTVLSRGRRTALAQATITDAAGHLAAHATSTCLLFAIPGS
jgi:uncharacterized protein (TIGR00369 family)